MIKQIKKIEIPNSSELENIKPLAKTVLDKWALKMAEEIIENEAKLNEIVDWINSHPDRTGQPEVKEGYNKACADELKRLIKDKCPYCGSEKVNGAWICMCPIGYETKPEECKHARICMHNHPADDRPCKEKHPCIYCGEEPKQILKTN